ncbi:DUF7010 family protein [Xylanibacter ruminicola]|uniref:DUF7010 family protein n=1 Tax=Xylanibacter ruminicola TaxID=839 RepID=UPI00049130F8|nr:hypothetical protein [Xylanibacter ruminicola]
MELNELIKDCSCRQKKGLHFILASIVIWLLILGVHLTNLPIEQKDIFTFCCSAVLFPLAWMLSKALKIDFEGKGNPLTKAGILFSVNQMLYILIAMWTLAAVPQKMLMVYAMIFGAHLMPFSWLYQSKSYLVFSIVVPILSLIVGLLYPPYVLAAIMVIIEAVFSLCLYMECKRL